MYIEIAALEFYEYSLYIKGYSKQTIRRYRQIINYFSRYAGIETMDQISSQNVSALFFHGRTERNWKSNSFVSFRISLLVFFRWCIRQGYMTENPAEDIEVPKRESRLPPKLTKQEALRLLEITYNYPSHDRFLRCRNHAIFAMFLFAGLRRNELLQLRFSDVDIENFSIFVNQGKGRKDRVIPMSLPLANSLKRYLAERKRLHKTCPEFFASYVQNVGFKEIGIKRLVVKFRELSGIKFSVHKLRHTFATLMLEGGCDIYSLSKMMGHSDIKTTTIYLAASAEHLRAQMTKHPLSNMMNYQ